MKITINLNRVRSVNRKTGEVKVRKILKNKGFSKKVEGTPFFLL